MKKYIIFILSIICLTFTKVNATNVRITDIELDSKSEEAIINNEATFADLQINTDIKFVMLNDYVKYKITITNEDNEDYSIDLKNNNLSEYLEYSYENSNTIKANSTTTVYMTIKYIKLVEDAKYTDYKYNENNTEIITLKNSKNEVVTATVENPKTGNKFLIIAVVIAVGSLLTIILLKHKIAIRYSLIIITTAVISIPVLCSAISNLTLTLNSKVDFAYANNKFCVADKYDVDLTTGKMNYKDYYYRDGMTFNEFFASDFFDEEKDEDIFAYDDEEKTFHGCHVFFNNNFIGTDNTAGELEIQNKTNGCYEISELD